MYIRIKGWCLLCVACLCFPGCWSVSSNTPPQEFETITGATGAIFIRGTFDLPNADRAILFAHLRAYDRPMEIEEFAKPQEAQFFRSIHLGSIPYRGPQALQFSIQQEARANKCFGQKTWTLLGWLSQDAKANVPQTGEKYSLFHLNLEPCNDCASGQFCGFGSSVRPHLNLAQEAP